MIFASCLVLVSLGFTQPAYAADDDPHGGVEPGTHPGVELPEPAGGTGAGSTPRDPGTLVIIEPAPPIDSGSIYPDTEDKTPAKIRTQFGGMTDGERSSSGGGSDKGGDSSGGGDKVTTTETVTTRNLRAGKPDPVKPIAFQVVQHGSDGDSFVTVKIENAHDLKKIAVVTPVTSVDTAGQASTFAYTIVFSQTPTSSPGDIARGLFGLTSGAFSACVSHENYFFCTFATPKPVKSASAPLSTAPPVRPDERQVPVCSNTMKDGGYGSTTIISVDDVDCEAAPGKEPVRLEVSTIYSDLSLGIPTARMGDGAVVYSATAEAQGTYVSAEVWAVAANGTYSLPFSLAIRNRYAPAPQPSTAATPVQAVRGVDTVVPASRLFSDVDVDQHAMESGDHLTSVVTDQGAMGGAWFDAAGNLHYQSIDVIHGDYTDHVTVQTTDSFGLPSPELRLSIHITDIVPGCANGGTTTDALTPVRLQLTCWITPADGWRQIDGLHYRITDQPEYGTVSDLDPDSGIATYTPDPAHPGPVTIGFTATNNGAIRDAAYAVDVLPVP
ncbi:hypothetical protein [Subtercola boreus]|uniref:hypothetical protein n=1 Tax=Subtercola boreus TaxID=120213 RepID=UPI001151B71F|nr:hypothetical protein [Subtercola boreus]